MYQHGGDIYSHKKVIDFSANINYKGMPESVKKALEKVVEESEHYPDVQCNALRKAIGQREEIPMEQIICGNGAADLIFTLVLARKPKKALVLAPTFFEYEHALQTINCEIEKYYLQEVSGFQLQDDFVERITPKTDMVFVCNPNNPTGVLTEREFLTQVLHRCERCNAVLVVDECFNDFLDTPAMYSMKECLATTEHLFLLKAFTKMYAMAGLRLGYGLCNDRSLLSKMEKYRQPWGISVPAQLAGVAAAKDVEFSVESRTEMIKEREYLKQEITKLGFFVTGSKANYIFFQGPRDLHEICLARGFLIRDCSNYEGLTNGWYRIAVRGREENQKLLEALQGV